MSGQLLTLTADIVSAYIEHNEIDTRALPELIRAVYQALAAIGASLAPAKTLAVQGPAVPIRQSVFPDHIVCLEDGKKLKLLKRYLFVQYGITPDDYRQRWGLPPNYPMAAPNYVERQSAIAKNARLGKAAILEGEGLPFRSAVG